MTNIIAFPVQKNEIVPGAVFYHTHAVPRCDGSLEVWTRRIEVIKAPYDIDMEFLLSNHKIEMFGYRAQFNKGGKFYEDTASVKDANVGKREGEDGYNLHRLFRTEADAKRYTERMEKLQFVGKEESIYLRHLQNIQDDLSLFDSLFDLDD